MRQELLQKSVITKTVWSSLVQSVQSDQAQVSTVKSANQVQFGSVQSGPKGPHFSRSVGSLLKYYLQNIQVYIALKARKCPKLYFYLLTVKGKRAFPIVFLLLCERNARNFLFDMELSDQALAEALSFFPFSWCLSIYNNF